MQVDIDQIGSLNNFVVLSQGKYKGFFVYEGEKVVE